MHAKGGKITFARYMELALYEPGLGYYSGHLRKFGPDGDFVTAPEISPLFSQCIAKQCAQVLIDMDHRTIFEFGAGTGKMAADILITLEKFDCLPDQYLIMEISADLQARQKSLINERCPHLVSRVKWLSKLPTQKITGVILGNEILDAMPVHQFYFNKDVVQEYYVVEEKAQFTCQLGSPSIDFDTSPYRGLENYTSEINFNIQPWFNSINDLLQQGLVLLIDYGFPQNEYYHPERHMGTIMCHYQHHSHTDPLILCGLQDITAHVNFSAVADAARNIGFNLAGYTNQANFLINCGITELLQQLPTQEHYTMAQGLKQLMLPSEMGELFKAIALSKGLAKPLIGFTMHDHAERI